MKIKAAFLGLLSLLLLAPAWAEPDWKLIRDDKRRDIRVYLRKDNYRVFTNKIETTVDAPLQSLVAAILDVDNMTRWVWRLSEARVLEQKSPTDFYLQLVISSPYGVEDRDAVIRVQVSQDPASKTVIISSRQVAGYLPEQKPLVRMAALEMNWRFHVADDGRTDVEMAGVIDPGGGIPDWTANMIQRDALYTSLKNLLRRVKEKEYAKAQLPFTLEI